MPDEKLLTLPWQIQVALGSGYAAYMLAYIGIRDHQKGIDVAFRAIAFGSVSSAVLYLCKSYSPLLSSALAFSASIVVGLCWRYFGMGRLRKGLRWANISWADDTPTAWATIASANSQHKLTQLAVLMDDGTWLNCSRLGAYNDDPFGPCILGQSGDIALYVTDEVDAEGKSEKAETIRDEDYGVRLTYVPAAKIKRIAMRHL
jgi:hypothetical protein